MIERKKRIARVSDENIVEHLKFTLQYITTLTRPEDSDELPFATNLLCEKKEFST